MFESEVDAFLAYMAMKGALIWILDKPFGVTSRAWLMRRAVRSMGVVSERRRALAQQSLLVALDRKQFLTASLDGGRMLAARGTG